MSARRGITGGGAAFGARLLACRRSAGLSQQELAERSGLTVKTISNLERGQVRSPHPGTVRRLADALALRDQARAEFLAAAGRRLAGGAVSVPAVGSGQASSGDDGSSRLVPRLLPAATASFTGRQDQVAALLELAAGAAAQPRAGVVMISAIDGMAGVGKTALALQAAHLLAGRFPDGQLFADLHGHTSGLAPMTAGEVLDWLLRWLGIPPQLIPQDLDARAAFYRDRLAGTRTLIVLDNAASTGQIRPLIPAADGCLVIVTSRKRLTGLDDAQALSLDVLPEPEAIALFHAIAGAGRPPAVARVVELCGYLPLAIRIAAARLHHQPGLTAGQLSAELDQEHRRLARLSDDDRSLTVAFDLSYRHLPPAGQAMFRVLGLLPGPEADGYAAAALADCDLETAEHLLELLWEHNLLLRVARGRFRLHDLLRLHARARADTELPAAERDQTTGRLLDYYLHTARLASACLARSAPPPGPAVSRPPRQVPELASQAQAMAWMRAELGNLTAALQLAIAGNHLAHAATLPAALAAYLDIAGPYWQAIALHTAAAEAATTLGDRGALATALGNLCRARAQTADFPAATAACQRALDLYEAIGDRRGQASALDNLGLIQAVTGDYSAAATTHQRALDLYEAIGDRRGQASALDNLGAVLRRAGDYPAAVAAHQQAQDLYEAIGDHRGHAWTVNGLGAVRLQTEDFPAAATAFQQALDLFTALGDRRGQAAALTNLGLVRVQAGDFPAAVAAGRHALDLFTALGDSHGQAHALDNLAMALGHSGDYPAAITASQQSLNLLRDLGDPRSQAEVLNNHGKLLTAAGQPGRARACHRTALALARRIQSAPEEAQALEGIGGACLAENTIADATSYLCQALTLYRQLGLPAADRIQTRLDDLTHHSPPH